MVLVQLCMCSAEDKQFRSLTKGFANLINEWPIETEIKRSDAGRLVSPPKHVASAPVGTIARVERGERWQGGEYGETTGSGAGPDDDDLPCPLRCSCSAALAWRWPLILMCVCVCASVERGDFSCTREMADSDAGERRMLHPERACQSRFKGVAVPRI